MTLNQKLICLILSISCQMLSSASSFAAIKIDEKLVDQTKRVLRKEAARQGMPLLYWKDKSNRYIEYCGGDWCQEVRWKLSGKGDFEQGLIAIYMMATFFSASDEFRESNKKLSEELLNQFDECKQFSKSHEKAVCAIQSIKKSGEYDLNWVKYDEDSRCVGPFSPKEPNFGLTRKCTRGSRAN